MLLITRKKFRSSTTSQFLLALAITDTLLLWTGLTRPWLLYVYDIPDPRTYSDLSCKLHRFIVYWSGHYVAGIIICLNIERFTVIFFPLIKPRITRKIAWMALFTTGLMLFIVDGHFFFTVKVVYEHEDGLIVKYCFDVYQGFYLHIWPWIDFAFYSLVPFIVLLIVNTSVICKILHSNYTRRRELNVNLSQSKTIQITSMTIVFFTISAWHFLTTGPISIFLILQHFWSNKEELTAEDSAYIDFCWAIVYNVSYCNNSANFILYITSSSNFRSEFICMLRRDRASKNRKQSRSDSIKSLNNLKGNIIAIRQQPSNSIKDVGHFL